MAWRTAWRWPPAGSDSWWTTQQTTSESKVPHSPPSISLPDPHWYILDLTSSSSSHFTQFLQDQPQPEVDRVLQRHQRGRGGGVGLCLDPVPERHHRFRERQAHGRSGLHQAAVAAQQVRHHKVDDLSSGLGVVSLPFTLKAGFHCALRSHWPPWCVFQVPDVLSGLAEDPQDGRHLRYRLHCRQQRGPTSGMGLYQSTLGQFVQWVSLSAVRVQWCKSFTHRLRCISGFHDTLWYSCIEISLIWWFGILIQHSNSHSRHCHFCDWTVWSFSALFFSYAGFSFGGLISGVTRRFSTDFEYKQVRLVSTSTPQHITRLARVERL